MTAYPYCKAKKLEVRHIGGFPEDVIIASHVESILQAENKRVRDLQRKIAELTTDIAQIYAASNG